MGTGEKVRGHLERFRMAMTVLEEVGKWATTSITNFYPAEMNLKLTVISSVSLVDISCIVNTQLYYFLFLVSRPIGYWLSRAQSLLYCNEHGVLGSFSEEVKSCICPAEHPICQGVIPCVVGTSSSSCSTCASDNATRCGACHHGNILHLGSCRPNIAASLDHYLSLDLDMPDAEVPRFFFTSIYLL